MSRPADPPGFDVFLSHASPDKPWVIRLAEELTALGLRVFLDRDELRPADNFVLALSDGLERSRFLVLIHSVNSAGRAWVQAEWTGFLTRHGPLGRVLPVLLDDVPLPPIISWAQGVRAADRDAARAAAAIARRVGLPGALPADDGRRLFLGQQLVFVLERDGNGLRVTDPSGRTRTVTPPWSSPGFTAARLGFSRLTRQALHNATERGELAGHAAALGRLLFDVLFDEPARAQLQEAALLGQRPLVELRSTNDELLALPWELLQRDGSFLVRDGVIDLSRSTPDAVAGSALLHEPTAPFALVTNVSAPAGSGLNYEEESYRIALQLSGRCRLTPTELGTLADLLGTVEREKPTGVHFSGHGGPGVLEFEDDEGGRHAVAVTELMTGLRRLDAALPPFWYLSCCHGNDPGAAAQRGTDLQSVLLQPSAESVAASLHRAGVTEVVGYHGPIVDELSTRAEAALYGALAEGRATREAVREARNALLRPRLGGPDGDTHPFAWAQLVFYHRGPEFPLGKPEDAAARAAADEALHRDIGGAGKRRVLRTGFIGRRTELHRLRRRVRRGDRVFVLQGLGGLGKTTLTFHMLPLLGIDEKRNGVCVLWCGETENERDQTEALVAQLLAYCRGRFGAGWESIVQQVDRIAGGDAFKRFGYYFMALLDNVPRLVLVLDNLESLLGGPSGASLTDPDPLAFGAWRTETLAGMWRLLSDAARDSGKLHVVASCRYQHDDFGEALLTVSPLPPDATFRLTGWFPALRRLTAASRERLVGRLAGHPRAVEYANDLIADALAKWKRRRSEYVSPPIPSEEDVEREWRDLVEPALPKVREKLWANLLLAAIWDNVLDDKARRMLYRMTLLRRAWDWDLMAVLGEANEPAAAAEETAERLCRTSLVERAEVGDRVEFTLHPATAEFVLIRFGDDAGLRLETHRRVGVHLEEKAKASPYIEIDIEAGHHLFEAAEYDRAYELLGPASEWLQNRGRVQEGLLLLVPFLTESIRPMLRRNLFGRLVGTIGSAHLRLSQVEQAISFYEQALVIVREIKDRRGEGTALGSLGNAYAGLGQTEKAIGFYEKALVIVREIKDRQGEGNALSNLGLAYARLGQTEQAIGFHEQALVIVREIKDRQGEGAILGNLGLAYARLGQTERAIVFYEQQLVIVREIKDRQGEGNALGNLGNAYADLGQTEMAIGFHEQALVVLREIEDRQGEGAVLGNLGLAYAGLGQTEKAIGFHEQQLVIVREIKDRRGEGNALSNLGLAYADLGQTEKAMGFLEQALAIGQEIKDPQIIGVTSRELAKLRGDAAAEASTGEQPPA